MQRRPSPVVRTNKYARAKCSECLSATARVSSLHILVRSDDGGDRTGQPGAAHGPIYRPDNMLVLAEIYAGQGLAES